MKYYSYFPLLLLFKILLNHKGKLKLQISVILAQVNFLLISLL